MKDLCFYLLIMLGNFHLFSQEIFDKTYEYPALQNITQLTFPSMGFEKAGEAYFSPDGETIVFQAVPTGESNYQIYSMNIEEGIPKMVSTGKGACTCAFFRPDGEKIIFASSHENVGIREVVDIGKYKWDFTPYMNIYEANPDGTNLVALTSGSAYHAECAYSPDGSRIIYASNADGCMNIYTMKSDGSDVQQITHSTSCYNGGPFYSADGTQIIYRADPDRADYLQIYMMDADGSNMRQLTNNGAVNWAPYWYPNGKVIAFTTSIHGHWAYEVYLLNLETGLQNRLTHNSSFDGLPVFNDDGTKFMWTSKRGADKTCQIFIADFLLPNEMKN